jgi:MoxR-like ATPase
MTRTPAAPPSKGLLRALGIAGWGALEPAILAALATESPILLVGPHGTAKTLLLGRLAEALGLAFRHYNASILNFDDLLGYPVPQDGRLVYLQTPATIWEAEAVLFDEVSRCRPELQNKLFPLVHERVVQGLPLTKLRHRWAAMNPPPGEHGNRAETVGYEGAEPLDVALADRFAFVLEIPVLAELGEEERRSVLLGGGRPAPDAGERLKKAVDRCRGLLASAEARLRWRAAEYTDVLAAKLAAAGHPLSTRRAVTLVRNVESLWAAQQVLGAGRSDLGVRRRGRKKDRALEFERETEDVFYSAARFSVPDAAWGRPVEGHVLLAAHRTAWEAARLAADSPERALLAETRPLHRIALALQLELPPGEAGAVIADGFASLPRPVRLVTSAVLFPRLAERPDLPATTLEAVAAAYAAVARSGRETVTVRNGGQDWKRELLGSRLAALDPKSPRDRVLHNAAAVLMADDERFDLNTLVQAWDEANEVLSSRGASIAAPSSRGASIVPGDEGSAGPSPRGASIVPGDEGSAGPSPRGARSRSATRGPQSRRIPRDPSSRSPSE